MKTAKIISFLILIAIFSQRSFSQTGWFQQTSGTGFDLYSVFAVDANTVFAIGNSGTIIKTTNGGINWNILNSGTTDSLFSIFFTDGSTGFACGSLGLVLRTTNGGLNWSSIIVIPSPTLRSIYFPPTGTGNTGFISGLAQIFKTTNAGINWTPQIETGPDLYSIYFADALTGYVCGSGGAILKCTNGGPGWLSQASGTTTGLRAIQFINSSTGWATGNDSHLYKTTNGGTIWTLYYNQSLCGLYSLYFPNELTGWVCGCEGAINGTTNNGASWILQSFASTTYLYSMSFASPLTGWAVGAGGRILKTTTGGITNVQRVSNEIPNLFSLYQNYPNPFNPNTKIKFALPKSSFAKLVIYDMLGREIATLVNEQLNPGVYEVNFDGTKCASGIYYYKLMMGEFKQTKKMILLK